MSASAQSIVLWLGITLLLAAAVHFAVILAIPYVVGVRLRSLTAPNTIVHAPKPSADYNPVRRSSPDLIYSGCSYDLSRGPLRVTAPVAGTYASVSCFALNTDNFYAKNDRQAGNSFDFILVGPGDPKPETPGVEVVRSPTTTGGVIFRYFVGDGTREAEIESLRREICVVGFLEETRQRPKRPQ